MADLDAIERGSGRTTRQMQDAPGGALFVWCNAHLSYPTRLVRVLGRDDLRVVCPYWLELEDWQGCRYSVVVDHAADLTPRQRDAVSQIDQWAAIVYGADEERVAAWNAGVTHG